MKYGKNILGRAATLAAAVAMTAGLSMAGDMSFNLPFDAVWNGIALAPGPYKLSPTSTLGNMPVLRLSGNGKSAFITMPTTASGKYAGTTSLLHVVTENGVRYIASFENATTNTRQKFSVPKTTTIQYAHDRRATTTVALALK